jgi:uncharacterized RDD family membrane protein YckC
MASESRQAYFAYRAIAYILDVLLFAVPAGAIVSVLRGADASPAIYNVVGAAGTLGLVAYFTVLEGGAAGATVGKRLVGLRVVGPDNEPIGYGRAFIRTLSRAVSSIPLYAGFLWCLVDDQRRTWHDILAGSLVVRTRPNGPMSGKGRDERA